MPRQQGACDPDLARRRCARVFPAHRPTGPYNRRGGTRAPPPRSQTAQEGAAGLPPKAQRLMCLARAARVAHTVRGLLSLRRKPAARHPAHLGWGSTRDGIQTAPAQGHATHQGAGSNHKGIQTTLRRIRPTTNARATDGSR